jgi:hypothetical protein
MANAFQIKAVLENRKVKIPPSLRRKYPELEKIAE